MELLTYRTSFAAFGYATNHGSSARTLPWISPALPYFPLMPFLFVFAS
jgi:hypothetical protein